MNGSGTFRSLDQGIDAVIEAAGPDVVLGIPLGIGKPNRFVNALYRRVAGDPALSLRIVTALTLVVPAGRSVLEKRFLEPIVGRLYAGYEPLDYAWAVHRDALPDNVEVAEFYFAPGAWLGSPYAQRRHVSMNYSHVTRALIDRGVNVVAQRVACRPQEPGAGDADAPKGGTKRYSLGSNADLILDFAREAPAGRRPFLVGVVSPAMPFMPHDAEVAPDFWDAIVDEDGTGDPSPLFVVPNRPVGLVDYAIATHVASLVADGGTLQIGIGSLGDAICHVTRLRQLDNDAYRRLCEVLIDEPRRSLRGALPPELGPFAEGLYGASEMLVEGFLHLIDAGVIKRRVAAVADPTRKVLMHAAFFLGSAAFYARLHAMDDDERDAIEMTGVRFVNTLADDWQRKTADRVKARFINSAMMVTLDGAVISDALDDKRVVSGVGGQHDFIAMAHRLPDARSIIAVPAARTKDGRTVSNIVFEYGHTTVPRQFRDIVVTEYGAADLRGASDRDVMVRLLAIADSRFQDALLERAQQSGKVEAGYRIPDDFRRNTPARLDQALSGSVGAVLPHFPLGTDFSDEEARIAVALAALKASAGSKLAMAKWLLSAPRADTAHLALLERMGLGHARSLEEWIARRLLLAAIERTRDGRPLRAAVAG